MWDLQEHVLQSISEVEKLQKPMIAIAGSLCKDHWLFYASEGSASIKVTSVDSREIPKKISRKAANRSCQLVSLAYSTGKRTLCCGSSDGSIQFWFFSEDNALGGKEESAVRWKACWFVNVDAGANVELISFNSTVDGNTALHNSSHASACDSALVCQHRVECQLSDRRIPEPSDRGLVAAREYFELSTARPATRRCDSVVRDASHILNYNSSLTWSNSTLSTTCRSPQIVVDFAKRGGELSFYLHPQLPLLVVQWHSANSSSSVIAWEFRPSIGGGSGVWGGGALSEWSDLIPAGSRGAAAHGGRSDEDNSCTAGVCWFHGHLVCYKSTHTRSLSIMTVEIPDATSSWPKQLDPPSLSSQFSLTLEQYWNYQEIPANLVQITTNQEPSRGAAEFVLQHFALQTGTNEKLDDLPVWKNYQGKALVPWDLVANQNHSIVCVKLRDPAKVSSNSLPSVTGGANASSESDDGSFSYVVVEIKQKAGRNSAARRSDDTEGGEDGGSSSSFRVVCGSQLDALDFCFAEGRSEEAKQTQPWVLVVLASTGKSLCLQMKCDQVESVRILLRRDMIRVFSSPIPLTPQSPHCATVGSRLLYLSVDSGGRQVLLLSDDELNVPASAQSSWKALANELVVNVTWNKTTVDSGGFELLAAVQTTRRLVILNKSLSQIREYDLARDLHEPQSLLWIVQTLLFVTKNNQLRYLTPLRTSLESPSAARSRLVCCLGDTDSSAAQHTTLLSVCGDRLALSITCLRSLEVKVFLRPIAICEPLLAGFVVPSEKLKAILERDVLVFAMSGGAEAMCPLTDYLSQILYHEFGWRETTMRLLDALTNPSGGGAGGAPGSTAVVVSATGSSSAYPKTSHLSPPLLASLYLHSHKWKEFLKVFLATDPSLDEYALVDEDSGGAASSAKLPSRTGQIAQRFRKFGQIMDTIGQSALAIKCFDLAGDDLAILEMTKNTASGGLSGAAGSMLTSLQKDWATLNPPLSSLVNAEGGGSGRGASAAQLDSVIWRRHDLFSLLCCDVLQQNERRSRLLTSVKPFDRMTLSSKKEDSDQDTSRDVSSLDKVNCPRASVLQWKRLVPEDAKDCVGVSVTPHFSLEDPKNPNYGGLASSSTSLLGSGAASGITAPSSGGLSENGGIAMIGGALGSTPAVTSSSDSGKMTIGPFVDDEDAVVAYWRFEEGATLSANEDSGTTAVGAAVESMDTSKRENNLKVMGFGATTKLVASSAPVDKGEEGRIQEAFALRFLSTGDSEESITTGARCNIRAGSTLDIGFLFDEDPYRRKLTFEAWVRNFELAAKQQQAQDDDSGDFDTTSSQFVDSGSRMLVCRRGSGDDSSSNLWWSFSLVDGFLVLEFAGQSIRSDERVMNAASWHHVAFTVDILSPKQASVKLFLQGRCVGSKDLASVESNAKLYANAVSLEANGGVLSYLHLGWKLANYQMTEVRVWAAARTQDQLSDMKENYLGLAEAKRRMKIAIHQRNCQCDKCHARRSKAPVAKLAMATPFPTTPPSSASVRDRRRPQPKQ